MVLGGVGHPIEEFILVEVGHPIKEIQEAGPWQWGKIQSKSLSPVVCDDIQSRSFSQAVGGHTIKNFITGGVGHPFTEMILGGVGHRIKELVQGGLGHPIKEIQGVYPGRWDDIESRIF